MDYWQFKHFILMVFHWLIFNKFGKLKWFPDCFNCSSKTISDWKIVKNCWVLNIFAVIKIVIIPWRVRKSNLKRLTKIEIIPWRVWKGFLKRVTMFCSAKTILDWRNGVEFFNMCFYNCYNSLKNMRRVPKKGWL